MRDRDPKPAILNPGDAVKGTTIEESYLVYRNLSRDAAHPSITALKRHLSIVEDNGVKVLGLDVRPPPDDAERIQTIDLACIALMSVCIGVENVLGHKDKNPAIVDASERYQATKSGAA